MKEMADKIVFCLLRKSTIEATIIKIDAKRLGKKCVGNGYLEGFRVLACGTKVNIITGAVVG
jgi:hypothetical protein